MESSLHHRTQQSQKLHRKLFAEISSRSPRWKKDQGLVPLREVYNIYIYIFKKKYIYIYMLATGGVCLPVTSIYPLLRWHPSFEVLWTTSGARPVERRNDFRIVWCVSSATLCRYHRTLQENMKVYKTMNSKRCCVCVCFVIGPYFKHKIGHLANPYLLCQYLHC